MAPSFINIKEKLSQTFTKWIEMNYELNWKIKWIEFELKFDELKKWRIEFELKFDELKKWRIEFELRFDELKK